MAKILLVEDDKSLREIYGVRLMAEGYEIVSAGDGEEALALAIKERPDLIVSDVMMPKISGFDMLDILRSTTETRDVKVIMMTALSSDDQRARGESLGADRYLVKSQVGIEDVVRTVHEVLGDGTPGNVPAPAAPQVAPAPQPVAQPQAAPVAAPVETERPPAVMPTAVTPGLITDIAPAPAPLPQPTAPFSSPAPASLGQQFTTPAPAPQPVAQPQAAPADPRIVPQMPPAPVPTPQATPVVAPVAPVTPFQAPAPLDNPVAVAPAPSTPPMPAEEPAFTPPMPSSDPTPPSLDFSAQMEQALNEAEPTPNVPPVQ